MNFWLGPGALVSVNSLTKVTMIPPEPGEQPPPGATVIPPISPLPAMAAMAKASQEANDKLLADASRAAQEAIQAVGTTDKPAPWKVTFSEDR